MTAVLIVLIVCATAVFALRYGGRRLEAQIGSIKVSVDDVYRVAEEVNVAVNHKPAGEPTLYQHAANAATRITNLEGKVDGYVAADEAAHTDLRTALNGIEAKLTTAADLAVVTAATLDSVTRATASDVRAAGPVPALHVPTADVTPPAEV